MQMNEFAQISLTPKILISQNWMSLKYLVVLPLDSIETSSGLLVQRWAHVWKKLLLNCFQIEITLLFKADDT